MSGQPTQRAVEQWAAEVEVVGERIGRRFARSEPRRRAAAYLRGLLSDAERKNGWQLAEKAGDEGPYGDQHLLGRDDWDVDRGPRRPVGLRPRAPGRPRGRPDRRRDRLPQEGNKVGR